MRLFKIIKLFVLVVLLLTVIESRASQPVNEILSLTNLSISDGNQIDQDKDPLNASTDAAPLFSFNNIFLANGKATFISFYINPLLGLILRPPSIYRT